MRVVAELAVVVVLDHPDPVLRRVVQQLAAARQAHVRAGGILVRRRHEQASAARPIARRLAPGRRRPPPPRSPGRWHDAARAPIARVLQPPGRPDPPAAAPQVQGLLRAAGDHHLRRRTGDAARASQIVRDGLAQSGIAVSRRVAQPLRLDAAPRAPAAGSRSGSGTSSALARRARKRPLQARGQLAHRALAPARQRRVAIQNFPAATARSPAVRSRPAARASSRDWFRFNHSCGLFKGPITHHITSGHAPGTAKCRPALRNHARVETDRPRPHREAP